MTFNPIYKTVENEDCNLHYWYQGSGPLITFIPGGNGHGRQYNPIITLLSDHYTCLTFDRRQMSSSVVAVPKLLSLPQQARDIVAIIRDLGRTESIIFGSSLGGIIAFQFAIDFPDMTTHLISHESPTFSLYQIQQPSTRVEEASAKFEKIFVGFDDESVPPTMDNGPANVLNFWENEAIAAFHLPDFRKILKNGTSVAVMAGERSKEAFYARTTIEQAKILGCERLMVPGHHQGFEVEAEKFLPFLVDLLKRMDEQVGKPKYEAGG